MIFKLKSVNILIFVKLIIFKFLLGNKIINALNNVVSKFQRKK